MEDIIEVVVRGLDPLIEIGRTTTMHELAGNLVVELNAAGFVIVPREPTEAMIDAGYTVIGNTMNEYSPDVVSIYRTMLAAACNIRTR